MKSTARSTRTRSDLRLAVSPLQGVEIRDAASTGDGSWTIEGYAAVFEQETTLWDVAGWWRCDEEIATGAFDNVLQRIGLGAEVVHLNHGHDMKTAIAASDVSGIGALELSSDFHGLRYFARVDPADPDVVSLAAKMRRKIVRQSSFAFTVADEELVESRELDDGTWLDKWRILEVGNLYDVCACAQGAYPQTESAITERVASLEPLEAKRTARSIRRGRASYLEMAARASVARAGREISTARADVASLDVLVDAYQAVETFIALEQDPEDAADRDAAQGILESLDTLIQGESVEPADSADDLDASGRTPLGVGRVGRRSARPGPSRDAAASGEGDPTGAKARAAALTATTLRRARR